MTVLKTVADSERSELLDDGEGLPVYFEGISLTALLQCSL